MGAAEWSNRRSRASSRGSAVRVEATQIMVPGGICSSIAARAAQGASPQIAKGGSSCSCRAGHRIKRLQDCLRDSQDSLPDGWGSLRMHPRRTMTSPN